MEMMDDKKLEEIHANWPNSFSTKEELDKLLEEGLKSGPSERTGEQIIQSLKERYGVEE